MHYADVLIIGPLGFLVPRPVYVRLWVALAAAIGVLAVGLAAALLVAIRTVVLPFTLPAPLAEFVTRLTPAHRSSTTAGPVQVASQPAGAAILLGNRELGRTPAVVSASPGDLLVLRRDGFLDAFARAAGPSVGVRLWRANPDVQLLRPPVPGASIAAADFLPDGRVALTVEVPPTGERQPWAYDPAGARLGRLGHAESPGTLPSAVAIAPDGLHTATVLRLDGLDGAAADQLTLEGPDGTRQPLQAAVAGERLLDVSWSPRADAVLLLSERRVTRGRRFHLRLVPTQGELRDLADLPSEPVAGSWVWAPDGRSVAFLVRTSATALVALDTTTEDLRYLDDLRADTLPGSGEVAPATWTASGDVLYAAPPRGGTNNSAPALFAVAPGRVDAKRVGDIQPVWAPIVRPDGLLLTLARAGNDELVVRPADSEGHPLAEQRLGLQVSGAFAARWDLDHQQLLILRGGSGRGLEILLLRFGSSEAAVSPTSSTPVGSTPAAPDASEAVP
jgi:hypothetical protein